MAFASSPDQSTPAETARSGAHQPSTPAETARSGAHQPSTPAETARSGAHQPSTPAETARSGAHQPEPTEPPAPPITSAKIVIAGGFGVGKTTCVGAISEIDPINTEAWMTAASEQVDPLDPGIDKTTTTVAMDFGRLTIADDLVLYLFGTPGQARFWTMWDDLCRGAVGALVLADTRRLDASFAAVNYFEQDSDVPFVVCVNRFDGVLSHHLDEVRDALALGPDVPLTSCDARDSSSVAKALMAVVTHAMNSAPGAPVRDAVAAR